MPLDTTSTRRPECRPVAVEHRAIGPKRAHTRYVADPLAPSDGAARQRAEARVTELEATLAAAREQVRTLTVQAERMAHETREAVEARQAAAALERQVAPTPAPAGAREPRTLSRFRAALAAGFRAASACSWRRGGLRYRAPAAGLAEGAGRWTLPGCHGLRLAAGWDRVRHPVLRGRLLAGGPSGGPAHGRLEPVSKERLAHCP